MQCWNWASPQKCKFHFSPYILTCSHIFQYILTYSHIFLQDICWLFVKQKVIDNDSLYKTHKAWMSHFSVKMIHNICSFSFPSPSSKDSWFCAFQVDQGSSWGCISKWSQWIITALITNCLSNRFSTIRSRLPKTLERPNLLSSNMLFAPAGKVWQWQELDKGRCRGGCL